MSLSIPASWAGPGLSASPSRSTFMYQSPKQIGFFLTHFRVHVDTLEVFEGWVDEVTNAVLQVRLTVLMLVSGAVFRVLVASARPDSENALKFQAATPKTENTQA